MYDRLDPAPRVWQAPTYMINARDRRITHNVAKSSVDQILDVIAGEYLIFLCDLNLLITLAPPPNFILFYILFLTCFLLHKRPT